MSILIKGMEMPKGCYRGCPCYSYHYCNVLQRDTSVLLGTGKKFDDCPLVSVPAHGRLGDLDVLAESVRNPGIFPPVVSSEVLAFLRNAPTIIEAEEGE